MNMTIWEEKTMLVIDFISTTVHYIIYSRLPFNMIIVWLQSIVTIKNCYNINWTYKISLDLNSLLRANSVHFKNI